MTRTITAPDAPLTVRQREVVALIAAGCSNDEVGQSLGISSRTAKAHSDVLRVKLGVVRHCEALQQPAAGARHDDVGGSHEPACNDGHVRRRPPRPEPPDDTSIRRSPLLGNNRLPVPRPRNQHPHPRVRPVERPNQAKALDDPAWSDPRLPWLVCHRGGS